MPGKRSFDEQVAALDKLRQLPAESCIDPLRKALEQRNNFVVGKRRTSPANFNCLS
jgi:hypothetical protein